MSAGLLPPDLTDRDNGQQPYPRRQTAPVCGECGAPLAEHVRCEMCGEMMCPTCGCCPCTCVEVRS